MRKVVFFLLALSLMVASCYRQEVETPDAWELTDDQLDSISFYTTHHYTRNYNFFVKADSVLLINQQPSEYLSGMLVDTFAVMRGDRLVVADIMTMPSDTIDSVWVQVARDQLTMGWTHESELLKGVEPDNPIPQFIDSFSDTHLLIFMAFLSLVTAMFIIRHLYRKRARLVHFNDIGSFYPTALALMVASSAVFYSTIQLVDPDSWRHYYYHPPLNPFAVPLHLGLFLASVWAMLLVGLAALDDIRRHLSTSEAFFYCLGLAGVCAIDYVLFSISTLYYVGYPLLVAYYIYAIRGYVHTSRAKYFCGRCGAGLQEKGFCPHCGALNT